MAKESKQKKIVKVVFLIIYFILTIIMFAFSWFAVNDTVSWIFWYVITPLYIPLLFVLPVSLILTTVYLFTKKKKFVIVSMFIFICAFLDMLLVASFFGKPISQIDLYTNFSSVVNVENINIIDVSDLDKEVEPHSTRSGISVFGKNVFEDEYYIFFYSNDEKHAKKYYLSQKTVGFDDLFFVNKDKLTDHLIHNFSEKNARSLNITEDDIHSFSKDGVNCIYVFNIDKDAAYYDESVYYAFVIYNDEKIYASSYDLLSTTHITFDAEQTTERIITELTNKGCL